MRKVNVEVITESIEVILANLKLQPTLIDQINRAQMGDLAREGLLNIIKRNSKID